MKRTFFILFLSLLSTLVTYAQTYMVTRVFGDVTRVTSTNTQPIVVKQELRINDVINIGMYSMLELLDEPGQQRICLKTPGRGTLLRMIPTKGNSVLSISKQYIDYIKSSALNQRNITMSDPATITMQVANTDSTQQNLPKQKTSEENEQMKFRQQVQQEYEDFRRQCMEQYIEFTRQAWKEIGGQPPLTLPTIEDVPPIEYKVPDSENLPKHENTSVPWGHLITLDGNIKRPMPFTRIMEVPNLHQDRKSFTFCGTPCHVRIDTSIPFKLKGIGEDEIADGLKILGGEAFDNTIRDCLELRYDLQLSDWAYLLLLNEMAEQVYGKDTNEARLLTAYVYMQSGYKVRLASDKFRLYLLVASEHFICGKVFYFLNGDRYYSFEDIPLNLSVNDVGYPQEQSLSLLISQEQKFANDATETRTIQSIKYPGLSISFSTNQNLIKFFATYPTSTIGENHVSRWAMYANTPLCTQLKEQIYPPLQEAIQGCDEKEAAEMLLNLVQTGLEYRYDEQIWGEDRAFFAEESLYYPFCDCEDRSILFSRLVRDLLGLRCVLVYYPGHLATGIHFNGDIEGDYIDLDGERFIIADPTYIGAPVGVTMPGMDNNETTVILLQ